MDLCNSFLPICRSPFLITPSGNRFGLDVFVALFTKIFAIQMIDSFSTFKTSNVAAHFPPPLLKNFYIFQKFFTTKNSSSSLAQYKKYYTKGRRVLNITSWCHLSFGNKKTSRKTPVQFHSSTQSFLLIRIDIDYPMITEDAEFPLTQKPLFHNCLQKVGPNPELLRDPTVSFKICKFSYLQFNNIYSNCQT